MTLLVSLLVFIPKVLIGFAIAHLLWEDSDIPAFVLKLSLGVPLGLAISASLFFISMVAGLSPNIYSWIEFFGSLSLVLLLVLYAIITRKFPIKLVRPGWQNIMSISTVLAGALLLLGAFRAYSRLHPYGFEDAWTIWNFSSRFIFRDNSPAILLNSQFYNRFHPDYPVELSLNVAWGWFILKDETPGIPIALALLSTITLGTVFWATLAKWKGFVAAAIGTLIIFSLIDLPAVIGQYADPLFTLHILSATALFYGYLKTRQSGILILSGLLAGFSAWVKNEGILFTCVLSIICLIAMIRQLIKWNELKFFAMGLFGPLLVVLTYKRTVTWQNDLFSSANSPFLQLLDLSRWLLIGKSFVISIMDYVRSPISIVIILLIYILLIGFDKNETKYHTLLFLVFGGQLAGYFFIYLITPHNLQLHIATSIGRLASHLFPLAILWIFAGLHSPNLSIKNQA